MTIQESKTRKGGRDARRSMRMAPKVEMLPTLRRALPVVEPMDADQVEHIHVASLGILEDVGVIFRDPIALADWKRRVLMFEAKEFTSIAASSGN